MFDIARLSRFLVMFEQQQQQKRNKTNLIFIYNSITTLFRFSWCENTASFFACLFLHSYCFLTLFVGKAFAQLPKNIPLVWRWRFSAESDKWQDFVAYLVLNTLEHLDFVISMLTQ